MTAPELAIGTLRLLLSEIADARERFGRLADEIRRLDPGPSATPSRPELALLAVDLHSWYNTFESLSERLLTVFDGTVPSGDSSHAALLRQAARHVEDQRPALFAPERTDALNELRRFRHFFRHAYALDLSHEKLRRVLDPFAAMHAGWTEDLDRFDAFVRRLIQEIEAGV